jgi:hypothetical protein
MKLHFHGEWEEEVMRAIMEYSKKLKRGTLLLGTLLVDLTCDADVFNRTNKIVERIHVPAL